MQKYLKMYNKLENCLTGEQLLFSDTYLAANNLNFDTPIRNIRSDCLQQGLTFNLLGHLFTFDPTSMSMEITEQDGCKLVLVDLLEDSLFSCADCSASGPGPGPGPSPTPGSGNCPTNFTLVNINKYINVCQPNVCDGFICPGSIGTCEDTTCKAHEGSTYKGLQTTNIAVASSYCEFGVGGCQDNSTGCDEGPGMIDCINNNLKTSPDKKIDGIAAVPPAMCGTWHIQEGLSSTKNNLCYTLTSKEGISANIAVVDRCGGYCTCKTHPVRSNTGDRDCPTVCGQSYSDNSIHPWCPGVGNINTEKDAVKFDPQPAAGGEHGATGYAKATTCCGNSNMFPDNCDAAITDFDNSQHVDWCASSNHVHFDLDYNIAKKLFPSQERVQTLGILTKVEPYPCDPTRPF